MNSILVKTSSRTYPVIIELGVLRTGSSELTQELNRASKVFLISTENILQLWGTQVCGTLQNSGKSVVVLTMRDGESAKRLSTIEKLATAMVKAGADRHSLLVALGGGVVGDVTGFLASIFMRGIPVVQVPTTLLAQVDSAIGGKTGVNLVAGKNLVGTFHQPVAVLADPEALQTLPEREFRSGLFEAMKYGIIRNRAIFELMETQREALLRRDTALLLRLITECVKVKADVVSGDERESGERRILNFGHTIGHTLESATRYKHFLHGEAVGWGMIAAANLGQQMGACDEATAKRITELVLSYGPLPAVEVSGPQVVRLLQADKKTIGGVPHFVLAKSIGHVEIATNVTRGAVLRAVAEIARLSTR